MKSYGNGKNLKLFEYRYMEQYNKCFNNHNNNNLFNNNETKIIEMYVMRQFKNKNNYKLSSLPFPTVFYKSQ